MSMIFCHSSRWLELFIAFENANSHLILADAITNITFFASDEVLQICSHYIEVILREVQLRINDLRHFVRQHPHGWIAFNLKRLKLIRKSSGKSFYSQSYLQGNKVFRHFDPLCRYYSPRRQGRSASSRLRSAEVSSSTWLAFWRRKSGCLIATFGFHGAPKAAG